MGNFFKSLNDFSVVRNWKQALGFYFIYLLLVFVTAGLLGGVASMMGMQINSDVESARKYAQLAGEVVAFIACTTIAVLIIRAKNIRGVQAYLFILGSFFLCIIGAIGGLIIPAYLTTRQKEA